LSTTATIVQSKNLCGQDELLVNYDSIGNRPAGPYYTLSGVDYRDLPSNNSLQLSQFSTSVWFKANISSAQDNASNRFIVGKGGIGQETPGHNLNYGIWMTPLKTIQAGFESIAGTDYYVESPGVYGDNNWHQAVATYNGIALSLYIDGDPVKSILTDGATPDITNTGPLRIGGHALYNKYFFIGQIDEIRVWNRALTDAEIADGYKKGQYNATGQVLYVPFNDQ
jgi:hypothetical protein